MGMRRLTFPLRVLIDSIRSMARDAADIVPVPEKTLGGSVPGPAAISQELDKINNVARILVHLIGNLLSCVI